MSSFKDANGTFDLLEKLLGVPPCISVRSWIDNLACVLNNISISILHNKTTISFIDKSETWIMWL
jgi:hypothetical protein